MAHQIYIMKIDSSKLSTIWKKPSCRSVAAGLKKFGWTIFFRPESTYMQLEKALQEIKIQSRGGIRWSNNLYPKFTSLAMLNKYTEVPCWPQTIAVLLKVDLSLCLQCLLRRSITNIHIIIYQKRGKTIVSYFSLTCSQMKSSRWLTSYNIYSFVRLNFIM